MLLCHFDEGRGVVTRDVSAAGKEREGKLIGNPAWTQGRFGGALTLDGKGDAVDFGPCRDVWDAVPYATLKSGSVEFWFSPAKDITGRSPYAIIVECCQSPRFAIGADGQLEASYVAEKWSGETVHVLKSGLAEWKAGVWYNILLTWNDKGHFLFVNETPVASDNLPVGMLVGPNNVSVGAYFNGKDWSTFFAGSVDELRITRPRPPVTDKVVTTETLPSGLIKETRQVRGSVTGRIISYVVYYPPDGKHLPVFLHQYGSEMERTGKVNERVAGYGVFSLLVATADEHCGYDLQDYKDAIDDAFGHYADRIDADNVAIAGASYGGAEVFGMAVHFPYMFAIVVPIFGIADFGYDENESWYPMVLKNSPAWGTTGNMDRSIGDRATYRETRYLVRNAVFGARNNPYAHFEILHDAGDGAGKPGVHVQQSRRYVAELQRLGYTNFRYTETPKEGFVYPQDDRLPRGAWGVPITYGHSFYSVDHTALYHFELFTLKPNLLSGAWKRPPFRMTGEMFIPSFLEVPYFRFDLGRIRNNCDEAADVTYDVSSPDKYAFQIVPRTALTTGKLRLAKLRPNAMYVPVWTLAGVDDQLTPRPLTTDAAGALTVDIPTAPKGSKLALVCGRT
jgi:hypothetical protein